MLRADLFTLATADALARLSVVHGVHLTVIIVCIPVVEHGLCIHAGKQIRYGDVLRTAVHTVAARRTGDHMLGMENIRHSFDRCQLVLIQRLEILHIAQIIFHLLESAHTGKHHHHAVKAGCKTHGIARSAAAAQKEGKALTPEESERLEAHKSRKKIAREKLVQQAATDPAAAAELAKKRAHQSQATKKSRQKMYEEAATGNPEAVERYENYLVTRRESYHRKKQEAERTA